MLLKILMSLAFLIVFVLRVLIPSITIDTVSIVVLILVFIPWIIQYIKSFEINGFGKFELFNKEEKEKIDKKASDAGLLNQDTNKNVEYTFYKLRDEDVKLALAGLRIEIESNLRKISKKNDIYINKHGITQITKLLKNKELIDKNEYTVIHKIIFILNRAVHSEQDYYKPEDIDWVFDLGLNILKSLENKL